MGMWCVSLESIENNVEWHSSRLDHKQDTGGCEMCEDEATEPTNLRKHRHQEGVPSSFFRGAPSANSSISQPNKYIRASVIFSNLVMYYVQ